MIPLARVRAGVAPWVTPRLFIVVGLAAGVVTLLVSRSHATRSAFEEGIAAAATQHNADTLAVINDSIAVHTLSLVSATGEANTLRATHAKARAHVVIVSPTEVSIDGGEPVTSVPASLVVQVVKASDAALVGDSVVIAAASALLRDTKAEVMVTERQRDLAQSELRKSHARCGMKCGIAGTLGVLVAIALVLK